jgi:hypothetical protein
MKSHSIGLILIVFPTILSIATARQSVSYNGAAESHDSGGGLGLSSSYRSLGSIGLIGSGLVSSNYAIFAGYPAQIDCLPAPVLQVEQPSGAVVIDGSGRNLGVVNPGSQIQMAFTVRNTGSATLQVTGNSITGTHEADFSVGFPDGTEVAAGGSVPMTLTFHPGASGARNATLTLQSNDADGAYEITLTGTGNTAPTFAGYSVATPWQTAASISLGKLLSKAADADGDTLTVTAAGPNSAQGGTALLQSGAILYTPPTAFSGNDTFSVTIADTYGATVSGTVTVTVGPDPNSGGQGLNTPQLTILPGGHVGIALQGIPGRQYQIQRSPDLTPGSWTTIATVTAASNGAVEFTDEDPPDPSGFYRLRKP